MFVDSSDFVVTQRPDIFGGGFLFFLPFCTADGSV